MMRRLFAFVAVLLLVSPFYAQTVKWCIHPEYDEIDHIGETHYSFKCVDRAGKLCFFDMDGKELAHNVDADAITDFENGYAIVLNGNKIVGFFEEAQGHRFQPVSGEYMITEYPFFSEGLLVVADSKGKKGYMNTQGEIVVSCKYVEARPFMQGWASVEPEKKKVLYVNTKGMSKNPEGFHGGKLTKGSSFNENGEAIVANYQDYAVIGTNMQVIKKGVQASDWTVRSCDYAYDMEDGCRETGIMEMDEDDRLEVYSEHGAYGYQWKNGSDEAKLPAQFSKAFPFSDGRAIVAKAGKFGVVELVEGAFAAHWPKELRVYPDGQCSQLQFSLEVPASLNRNQVELEFDEGNGSYKKDIPFDYGFQPAFMTGASVCTLKGKASYDGLLLWEGSKDVKVNPIAIDIKSPAVTTEFADENDNQTVKTVITNTSDVDVLVEASLKVVGQTVPFKGTLKPKQSKALTLTVKVTESKKVSASVAVKADGHVCGSKTSEVSLKL